MAILVLIVVSVAGGWLEFLWWNRARGILLTGIVTTHEVNVSSQIQGRLARLPVREGGVVQAGQLIGLIEPQVYRADQAF